MRQRSNSMGLFFVIMTAAVLPAHANADTDVLGTWSGPVGDVVLREKEGIIEGRMAAPSPTCPFREGDVVLRGNLISGSLAGNLLLCLKECASADSEVWAFSMLVVQPGRMAGATHVEAAECRVPGRGENGAIVFERKRSENETAAATLPAGPRMPEGVYDPRGRTDPRERAMDEARAGANLLGQGRFEAARVRFEAAVAIDPDYAEGYNGIGVTHALRRDWGEAIGWYRRSIAAGPSIGDAYYNLACAYAQTSEPDLAVRYLRLSVLNGYAQLEHLMNDPDLAPLRERDDFRSVLSLGSAADPDSSPSDGTEDQDESRGP